MKERRIPGMHVKRLLRFLLLLFFAVAMAAPFAAAQGEQEWPQWRGPNRDGVATGFAAPPAWPAELKKKWSVTVGEGHSSPVVAGNRVYVFARQGERETLSAFDLGTGKVLWQEGYDAPYSVSMAARSHGKGPKSTPVVSSGRVYALGIGGILSCWDAATGKLRWRKEFRVEFSQTSPSFGAAMSPLVDRGLLIAHLGGQGPGALWAFDAETGASRWRWTGDGPGYASPIAIEVAGVRQIVTQSQDHIVGVNAANGTLLWKIPFTTDYTQNIVTPVVYKGLLILSGLNQATWAVRIEKQGSEWKAAEVWRNAEVPMYMSSPVVTGNLLVGMTHRNRGQMFVADAATGKTLWKGDGRAGDNAALIVAGGAALVQSTDGELIAGTLSDKGFESARRYRVADSATWAHPAVAGEWVLVKDVSSLTAWAVE